MESQKPKIAMYAKRSFGEKLNVSFDFIKENWKPLLKLTTYLILPLCLIQAMSLNGLMGGAFNVTQSVQSNILGTNSIASMGTMFFVYYAAYILLSLVGSILITSVVYGLIQKYNESDEQRLRGITLGAIKPLLFRNMKKLLALIVASIVLVMFFGVIIVLLAGLTYFTLILTIPFTIAFSIPLALWVPIYLFEDISLIASFKKTFRLGFATWGGILLIIIVMGIIASVLQGVTMTPWYVATLVKYFFSVSDPGNATTVSIGYNFMLYLLGIIQTYGTYLSVIFSLVGLAYQYGHATEVVDSITVESDIDNFDKL